MKKLLFVLSTALLASIVMAQPGIPTVPCPFTVQNVTPEQCQYATAMNAPMPEGNYGPTCSYVWWSEPGVLAGNCLMDNGSSLSGTSLKITPSCQYVQNINGQLRCN